MKKIIAAAVIVAAVAGGAFAANSFTKHECHHSIEQGMRCTFCNGTGFNGNFNCNMCKGTGRNMAY